MVRSAGFFSLRVTNANGCVSKKDIIIRGGENIYPAEIEAALEHHADVLEVAVFGVPSEEWGETVHAVVVPRAGRTLTPTEVIDHCRGLIAGYKCPKRVEFRESLARIS